MILIDVARIGAEKHAPVKETHSFLSKTTYMLSRFPRLFIDQQQNDNSLTNP